MGPVEFIGAAAKGAAKFASKHTTLTVLGGAAALGGGIVAYNNSGEADRTANGGAFMKQDVAVNDKNGDLRMKMRGLKGTETSKAAAVTESVAKPDTGNTPERLSNALNALKEADKEIEAKTVAEVSRSAVEEVLKQEKPYIPEQAVNNAYDETSANVLDGNGSAVFRPARFAASGSGSAADEQNRGNKASAKPSGVSKAKPAVGAIVPGGTETVKIAGSGEKAGAAASGKPDLGKAESRTPGDNADKGGGGLKTETKDVLSSDNKSASDGNGETANSPSDGGETLSVKATTVTPTTTVEDTVSTVAASKTEEVRSSSRTGELEKENARRKELEFLKAKEEEEQKRLLREKRNGLKQHSLQVLRNAFEKETDCDVDNVVPTSNRIDAGITSSDVMRLAAQPDKKVKCVTLYADRGTTSADLIALLRSLGLENRKGNLNPNVSFLLPNGGTFLKGDETIEGVALERQSYAVRITFPDIKPVASPAKKPDTKKPTDTTKKATKPASGVPAGGSTPTTTGSATGGTSDDWLGVLWNNAEEEARLKARTYDGSFKPDTDGLLYDKDLASDLKNGYYNGDELIDGILKYNENEAKKATDAQKPIVVVPVVSADGIDVFCRLSADQTARAKGLVFITDEAGAKEAEKDTKRFTTRKFGDKGSTLTHVFVLQDDGKLSDGLREVLEKAELGELDAAFNKPNAETHNDDGDRLTAEIIIPKDVTDVLGELNVFSETENFLQSNLLCQTKVKMHYRDADALKKCLSGACENDDAERLTLEFQNPLPENFAANVNAEAALCGLNVVTKDNTTVRFQKVDKLDEDAVKAYFEHHTDVYLPKYFTTSCSVANVMEFALNRTSDAPLRLNVAGYDDSEVENDLPDILKKISDDKNPKGLNLTIVFPWDWDAEAFADDINNALPDEKRHLIGETDTIRFEDPYEAYRRQHGISVDGSGALEVSDAVKSDIADGNIDGASFVALIWEYNAAFPEKKISYVVTEDLEPDESDTAKDKDIITFSPEDIQSVPDVTFRLKDISRQEELQDAGLTVKLQNAGTPDAYLIVSATKYNDASVKKIQNAWRNRLKEKKEKEAEREADEELEKELADIRRGRRNSFNAREEMLAEQAMEKMREGFDMTRALRIPRRKSFDDKDENGKNMQALFDFLQQQNGDITLNKEQSKLFFKSPEALLVTDFFDDYAGRTVTLDASDGDTSDLQKILNERGLELTDRGGRNGFFHGGICVARFEVCSPADGLVEQK